MLRVWMNAVSGPVTSQKTEENRYIGKWNAAVVINLIQYKKVEMERKKEKKKGKERNHNEKATIAL